MSISPGIPDGPDQGPRASDCELQFTTLLYRFLFFDWLFADMSRAVSRCDRITAWQHNRAMRRYLPVYLRRWSVFAGVAFALGWVFERFQHGDVVAAWFFAWSCVSMTGMLVISVLWVFLAREKAL